MQINGKSAFTLAEVLLTIGIIGIVAAITIPSLVENSQKEQYVAGLKKAYSQMQQMFKQYITDQGVESLDQTKLFTTLGENDFYNSPDAQKILDEDIVRKYLKVVKACKPGTATENTACYIEGSYFSGGSNDEFGEAEENSNYNFCTADGMCYELAIGAQSTCAPNDSIPSQFNGSCAAIRVDVNGKNPPNKDGRDFLEGLIVAPNGNLYPYLGQEYGNVNGYYWQNNKNHCGEPPVAAYLLNLNLTVALNDIYNRAINSNAAYAIGVADPDFISGDGCVARIIEEGWQMNY